MTISRQVSILSPTLRSLVFFAIAIGTREAISQLATDRPQQVEDVGIDEKRSEKLPLELRFTDSREQVASLSKFFDGQRPVILSFNYTDCPMLCQLQLTGLVESLRGISLSAGEDFRVVSVSIDASETPQQAAAAKQRYLQEYGRPGAGDGWSFLTGTSSAIQEITSSSGFRFRYLPDQKEFSHASAVIICTPDGVISRYLYGVQFDPQTVRLSLTEAADGKVGSAMDQLILFCFQYDSASGKYAPVAKNLMRTAAIGTALLLVFLLVPYWLRSGPKRDTSASRRTLPATTDSLASFLLPLLTFSQTSTGSWLPDQASSAAAEVDWVFAVITVISLIFFVGIVTALVYFVIRYRRRPGRLTGDRRVHASLPLEIAWSIIPAILLLGIFGTGLAGFFAMAAPPDEAYEIRVISKKWVWSFQYPNGYIDDKLHVPVDRPVQLVMSSDDVIHSMYIPVFRAKRDVIPGRYTKMWFEATKVGEFDLYCAEYCGTKHSDMASTVVVHPPGEFARWLEQASNFLETMSPADAGRLLYRRRGCAQCHSVDGSQMVGPSFLNLYGDSAILDTGDTITVDETYIRESILAPLAKARAGYRKVMPTYQGQLSDEEINAIIAWLKTLGDK